MIFGKFFEFRPKSTNSHLASVYYQPNPLHLLQAYSYLRTRPSQSANMLYLVGLGLSDETDITVKGLEVVKKASRVYLEAYTSILLVDQSVLVSSFLCERPRSTRDALYTRQSH